MLATHYTGVNKLVTGNTMGTIYLIRNAIENKCYIGKSVNDVFKGRIHQHFSGKGNTLIAKAVAKYGKDVFQVEILHDGILDFMLDELEIQEIQKHNSIAPNGYNLTTGGEGGSLSPETRKKIGEGSKRQWSKPETRKKASLSQKGNINKLGKKESAETRKKKRQMRLGKKQKAETKRKISESQLGKKLTAEHRLNLSIAAKRRHAKS